MTERMKELTEKRTGLKLEFLKDDTQYEEGKKYYCGYWGSTYEVLKLYTKDELNYGGWAVTVRWADGHETTHFTNLDTNRDFLVAQ
jgi:hypothetical protein